MNLRKLFRGNGGEPPIDPSDPIAARIVRAAGLDVAETESIVESPLLYSRVLARIDSRQDEWPWLDVLSVLRRAAVTFSFAAVIAAGLFWTYSKPPASPTAHHALMLLSGDRPQPASACAISAKQECAITRGDVLATIVAANQEGLEK
jgi:hypothetical protein